MLIKLNNPYIFGTEMILNYVLENDMKKQLGYQIVNTDYSFKIMRSYEETPRI